MLEKGEEEYRERCNKHVQRSKLIKVSEILSLMIPMSNAESARRLLIKQTTTTFFS